MHKTYCILNNFPLYDFYIFGGGCGNFHGGYEISFYKIGDGDLFYRNDSFYFLRGIEYGDDFQCGDGTGEGDCCNFYEGDGGLYENYFMLEEDVHA